MHISVILLINYACYTAKANVGKMVKVKIFFLNRWWAETDMGSLNTKCQESEMAYLSATLCIGIILRNSSIPNNPLFQKHQSVSVMCWKTVPLYGCLSILNKIIISQYFRISKYFILFVTQPSPDVQVLTKS